MYFLRKLKSFRLNNEVLYTFYCSILGSVITFGISCWDSSITAGDRKRLNSTIKKAGKIMNREVPNIEFLFHTACLNKYNSILKDNDHPLNCNFITSMRSNRIIQPKSRTERYRLSFIPTAVRLLLHFYGFSTYPDTLVVGVLSGGFFIRGILPVEAALPIGG